MNFHNHTSAVKYIEIHDIIQLSYEIVIYAS